MGETSGAGGSGSTSLADRPDFDELVYSALRRRGGGAPTELARLVALEAGQPWGPSAQSVYRALARLGRAGRAKRVGGTAWVATRDRQFPKQSESPLVKKGTRRLHLASGEVWRVQTPPGLPPLGGGPRRMVIAREGDGRVRSIGEDYWLGDSWGRPRSRAGARRS